MESQFRIDDVVVGSVPLVVIQGRLIEGQIQRGDVILIPLNNGEMWTTRISGIAHLHKPVEILNLSEQISEVDLAIGPINYNPGRRTASAERIQIGGIATLKPA